VKGTLPERGRHVVLPDDKLVVVLRVGLEVRDVHPTRVVVFDLCGHRLGHQVEVPRAQTVAHSEHPGTLSPRPDADLVGAQTPENGTVGNEIGPLLRFDSRRTQEARRTAHR